MDQFLKLRPGLRTEQALYKILLEPQMLGYWLFLTPKHLGKEIADVVLLWNDTIILFEAKTREACSPASPAWLRGRLGAAVGQLNAGADLLRSGDVALRNSLRGRVLVDPERIKTVFGLIVLMADHEPFDWEATAPNAASAAEVSTQVLTLFDLAELLRVFDTPSELIQYLSARAMHARYHSLLVGSEQTICFDIIRNWDEYWPGNQDEGREKQEYLAKHINAVFETEAASDSGYRALAASKLIDFVYKPTDRRADLDQSGQRIGGPAHDLHVEALGAVAELDRKRRSYYGEHWVDIARRALLSGQLEVGTFHSKVRSRSYVFVASAVGRDPSSSELAWHSQVTLAKIGMDTCLAIGAPASSILATFEHLVRICKRESVDRLGDEICLAPVTVWTPSLSAFQN